MEASIFYRILYTNDHITRWQQRLYTSNNQPHGPPPAWLASAAANQPAANYPLTTAGVVFLQPARDEFAAMCGAHGANALAVFNAQGVHVQQRQLEIAGVSAYTDPIEAYWHGGAAPDPIGHKLVTFWGFKVCDLGPEQAHGGVIAAVVKAVDYLTPAQFVQKFFNGHVPDNPHPPPVGGAAVQGGGPVNAP